MKKFILAGLAVFLTAGCTIEHFEEPIEAVCVSNELLNSGYSKRAALQTILDKYTRQGLPGIAMAVYSPKEGFWAGSSGYSKIETKTAMQTCQFQYLQSVTKMYMATAVLKLYEEGKIDLDQPISTYLPKSYQSYVSKAENISVRMLLNHTSGIAEYTQDPAYVSYLIQHPKHRFTKDEMLQFIKAKPLRFEPGTRHQYANTNYLLLAILVDNLTGNHAEYMQQKLFTPLGLTNTLYSNSSDYLQTPGIVNTYWSRFGTESLENNSSMQKANVGSMVGDDGMVATPLDVIRFMKSLMEGQVLKGTSLDLMKTWVNGIDGKAKYGMGLYYYETDGNQAFGHGGAGLGAGCLLFYFPHNGLYLFLATNVGTVTESPFAGMTDRCKTEILDILLMQN